MAPPSRDENDRPGALPASRVFHRNPHHVLPVAVSGEGAYVVARDGRRYLDASGGAAVSCLGHSDADVIEAIRDQAARLPYAHTAFFTSEPLEELASLMVAGAPDGLDWVYFSSGGSEAMETALKMARQYFVEIGQPQRRHFIARRQSYHGNTLGVLAVGGNEWRRAPFRDVMVEAHHVDPCYAYRNRAAGESDADYVDRLAAELEQTFVDLGPDSVIAFIAETVVGATSGAVPPVEGYFRRMGEICRRHGVLLILDEIMCGTGRTGTLYAFEQDGIVPDMVATSKGLAAGYQPIGALLVSDKIYRAFYDGSGFFQHGHTFMGHATACAGAIVVQKKLQHPEMMARVRALGGELRERLRSRFENNPFAGDIRGRGMFLGIELVRDRMTREPFDPADKLYARIKSAAMSRDLMCYPGGGTIDGVRGDHILLAPPFIVDAAQIDDIVARLGEAVDAAIAGIER